MITVTLPPDVAERVRKEATDIVTHGKKHKTEKYGAQKDRQDTRLERNINGFGAEEAACSWLGIDRTQRGIVTEDFKHDLGDLVEIRNTTYKTGRLLVHPEDDDDSPFVLAIGRLPTFNLMGWLWGREAKQPQYWEVPPDVPFQAYFVPADRLRSMEELLVMVGGEEMLTKVSVALEQATRERDIIERRWKELGQWPRPWTTETARAEWIKERTRVIP